MTTKHIGELAHEEIASLQNKQEDPEKYRPIRFGIDRLDEEALGVVVPSYVTIGGPAGLGKTAFALHVASTLGAAKRGKVLFCTLEELQSGMAQRSLSRISIVNRTSMLDLRITEKEFTELEYAANQLDKIDLYIEDEMWEMQKIHQYAKANGYAFIVVDYLQYLVDKLGKNEVERLAAISRLCVQARNRDSLTTIMVYQMGDTGKAYGTRAVYKDADLGIEFEQAIDSITEEPLIGSLWANIVKTRQGTTKNHIVVGLDGKHSRITNIPVIDFNAKEEWIQKEIQ